MQPQSDLCKALEGVVTVIAIVLEGVGFAFSRFIDFVLDDLS